MEKPRFGLGRRRSDRQALQATELPRRRPVKIGQRGHDVQHDQVRTVALQLDQIQDGVGFQVWL